MADIFEQARNKIGPGLIRSFFNSEGSFSRGGDYYILSPIRGDKTVGSFRIEESTGLWFDYATNEGGDFIELVSKAKGVDLRQAAEDIIKEAGGVFIEADHTKKSKKSDKKIEVSPPKVPIPDNKEVRKSLKKRVKEQWCLDNWGKAEAITRYYNENGEWVFVTCRFTKESKIKDKKRQKNDILLYLGENNRWIAKWHEDLKPFPPYGIEKLKENTLPYIIVEGEKCGRQKIPGYNVLSWVGGTSNADKTNWGLLKGREGYIWPDADSEMDRNKEFYLPRESQPGIKAAHYIKSQLPKAKILEVYRAKPIEDNPSGWDVADLIEEKGDPVEFIETYTPYNSVAVDIDSYQVYRKFIENFYDFDSLEQSSGRFWQYFKEEHFWRKVTKNDIYCNLQRWMEDTGLQWIVSKKEKVTKFINEMKQYIERHSLGYIGKDDFKDSAVSPYIHLKNGAIKITKKSIEWIEREKYGEDYFKKLHPIHCLDFEFDYKNYKNIDPEKDCPAFYFFAKEMVPREYMDSLHPDDRKRASMDTLIFLSQIIAYSLSPIKPNEYFFGIYGNQRTGKSFLLKIIKSIVGSEFCVERKISDMDNRFASSVLWGKKVFIEPDLKTRQPLPEDFIKAYAGEQTITVEEKNLPAVDGIKTSLALFFISNYEFHVKGVEGLARRLVMVPYKNNIQKHDARLLDRILGEIEHSEESGSAAGQTFDERPAILALAMSAWTRFCDNDYIMESPEWAQREKDLWLVESNAVSKFMEETYFLYNQKETISRVMLHDSFKEWCKSEERKPLGKKNFFEEVRRDERVKEVRAGGLYHFIIDPTLKEGEEDEIPF